MYPVFNDPAGVWRPASPGTATPGVFQGWNFTSTSKPAVTNPAPTTGSIQTQAPRTEWMQTTNGQVGGIISKNPVCWRGNVNRLGGFSFTARFSLLANPNNSRAFVGLSASATHVCLGANVNPSAVANTLGMGFDSTDPNGGFWYLIARDATTLSKIVLDGSQSGEGPGQALRNTTDVYDVTFFAQPNSSSIYVRIFNLTAGLSIYNGFIANPIHVPAQTANLLVHVGVGPAAAALTTKIDLYRLDLDSVGDGIYAPPATQPLLQLVSATAIGAGVAVQADETGCVQAATTNLRTQRFVGVAVELCAVVGQIIGVQAAGFLDPSIKNLGAAAHACAVGVDVNGNLVRATNAACVSAPNWIGDCDTNGNIIINPRRTDVYDVRDFGAIPDFDYYNPGVATDNLAAFDACLLASKPFPAGGGITERQGVVVYCPGGYYLSNTLHITHCLVLQGAGNGDETRVPGTLLAFPKNCNGIQLHSSVEIPNTGYNSAGSTIRDMVLWCKDQFVGGHDQQWPDLAATGSGIYSSAVFYVQDVTIVGFGADGISIVANAGPRVPPNNDIEFRGNADDSAVTRVRTGWCGRHGIFICGADANVIKVSDSSFAVSWGWGVYDVGGGSHFIGIDCSGNEGNFQTTGTINTGEFILKVPNPCLYPGFDGLTSPWIVGQFINIAGLSGTSDPNYPPGSRVVQAINIAVDPAELTLDMSADVSVTNATVLGGTQVNSHKNHDFKSSDALRSAGVLSTFIGCYSEAAINDVRPPSLVLGGYLAESPMYNPAVFTLNSGIMSRGNLVYQPDDASWRLDVGPANGLASSKSAMTVRNGFEDSWELFYEDVRGTWGWRRNGSGVWSMAFPTAVTNIRSPTSTIFRTGLYVGQPGGPDPENCALVVAFPGSPPTSGKWNQGDIVLNTSATAAAKPGEPPKPGESPFVGWVCVTSGDFAGTPPVFKTFGAISS